MAHPVWTDDEIVAGVREFAAANFLPNPAPAEAADEFDALTGLAMPPLLRRIYTEAANGGFGPCGGLIRRKPGLFGRQRRPLVGSGGAVSLTRTATRFSHEPSLSILYDDWTRQPPDEAPYFRRDVVPLLAYGGVVWWCIELGTSECRMWGWNENECLRQHLTPQDFTLEEWLTDWLCGNRTAPTFPTVPGCSDCSMCSPVGVRHQVL